MSNMIFDAGHGVVFPRDHGKVNMGAFGPGVHPSLYADGDPLRHGDPIPAPGPKRLKVKVPKKVNPVAFQRAQGKPFGGRKIVPNGGWGPVSR